MIETMQRRPGRKAKPKKVSLPGYDGQMELAADSVRDPYEPEKALTVLRNLKNTPLDSIFARGRLKGPQDTQDDALSRKAAGDRFLSIFEKAEVGGAPAIDYSRVKVDVSFVYRGLPPSTGEAIEELAQIGKRLGHQYRIIRDICGQRIPIMVWIERSGMKTNTRADRLAAYAMLREALDALIGHWGRAQGKAWLPIRGYCAQVNDRG